MWNRSLFLANLSLFLSLLSALCAAQTNSFEIGPGAVLPPLAGQALNGKWLNIAPVGGDPSIVVVFSFSRAGGRDAQLWIERLMKDNPHPAIDTVIFLESVPGLFRAMAVSGIKGGMPFALQDRTILMYRDEDLWRKRLRVTNVRHACVILLGTTGRVQWKTSGPFTDGLYSEFRKSIQALK